jgi:hypothetical protein
VAQVLDGPVPVLSTGLVFAVLGAALMHAVWNTIAHQITDRVLGSH